MVRKQVNTPGHFVGEQSTGNKMLVFSTGTKICDAMKEAGIADPDSQDGIDFCINKCPNEVCELDSHLHARKTETAVKVSKARSLHELEGYTFKEIAVLMGVSSRTVMRWLK